MNIHNDICQQNVINIKLHFSCSRLPGLEVRKVTISKRRKLFQDDNDIAVDII